jgi:phosphoserine phosphatase
MNAPNKDRVNRLVLELLAEDPDDAAVALFTRLCRQSPKLRAWLWDEFARSPKTRAEFARILEQQGVKADHLTLAHAAGEDRARSLENARLRGDWLTASTLRPYGGLSRPEVEGWIRRYQSGSLHPATFQLVLAWRRTRGTEPADAALVRASAAFLAEALGRDNRGLLRQLVRIERFFGAREKLGRAAYGHLHRWKVHLLLYVLNHPKRCYRTGELTAHLAGKKIRVSGKLIRRFCVRHGIARDTRPGRPRGRA